MTPVAKFEKVSLKQYIEDFKKLFPNLEYNDNDLIMIEEIWNNIKLPTRSDPGSAGYDFYCNIPLMDLMPLQAFTIPTGIRCKIEDGWALLMLPRSGMGFKYGMRLHNTIGLIDSSYYNADNEGHIMVKFSHVSENPINIQVGDRFVQGIFVPYGITVDDDAQGTRTGGFGSSGN